MNEQEFKEAILLLRSKDAMTYEEGYHWLLGNVDEHFDQIVSLMQTESNIDMRGKFIELLGDSSNEKVISVLEKELTSPHRDVRFWAHSQLGYLENAKAQEIATRYKKEYPNEDWY